VILITEFAHDGRPAGADPLDIRDQVVWLSPLVELDADRARQLRAALAGSLGWEIAGSGLDQARIDSRWNVIATAWEPLLVLPRGSELTLTRKLNVSRASDVVELLTACPLEVDEHEFRLKVNGRPVEFHPSLTPDIQKRWVKLRDRPPSRDEYDHSHLNDRLAYWWDLQEWRGQEVSLELSVRGRRERNEIAWRGLSVRGVIGNLPAGGEPLAFDMPLTSLAAFNVASGRGRAKPVKDGLPGERNPPPIRFVGQRFSEGYGLAMNSTISFPLSPEHKRFVAVAGCPTFVAGPMQVLIDGKVAWERTLMIGLDPAEQIDIAIPAGAKTLTLQTGPESSYTGFAAWAAAGFVTKP
jgi:hypothetical protein